MFKNIFQTIISILISTLIIVGLICTTKSNVFLVNTTALWIIAGIYLALYLRFILFHWVFQKTMEQKIRWIRAGIISALASLLILCFSPWKYGHVLTNNHIEKMRLFNPEITIHVEDHSNEASLAQEVWISAIKENNKDYNLYEIPLDNDTWSFAEGQIYTAGLSNHDLIMHFPAGKLYEIRFKTTPSSGIVRVSSAGFECFVDLYSADESYLFLNWEALYGKITTAPQTLRIIYYLSCLFVIWIMVFPATVYFFSKYQNNNKFFKHYEGERCGDMS